MTKKTYTYDGISFQQNPKSPPLFAFVAPAEELVEFSGVARKSEKLLTNYQRALDTARVAKEVAPFFRIAENCTPTAVVISLHETPLAELNFTDLSDAKGSQLNLKRLQIVLTDPNALSDDQVIEQAKLLLDRRLAAETSSLVALDSAPQGGDGESNTLNSLDAESSPAETPLSDTEDDTDESSEDDDETDHSEEAATESVEIGTSMLKDLRKQLDDKSEAIQIVDTLRDMLKPALIIDGQHRTFGAAAVEEAIPLLVCSLVKPEWKEQVFQFTVINDKAQGIPKPFITSLAGMSLTSSELYDLQTRLSQAGVQLWEVDVMQRLGYDTRSAFFQKIEFKTTGSGSSGLGYQTMKQLGRVWFEAKNAGLVSIYKVLYQNDKRASKKSLVSQWQKSEDWFKYFCIFWDKFKEKFAATPLWKMHSPLLTAVVLLQLQYSFLRSLGNLATLTIEKIEESDRAARSAKVEQKFREIVDNWSMKFTEKSFPTKWGVLSLNHKDGKDKLLDYFDKIANGSSVKNHPILTGK